MQSFFAPGVRCRGSIWWGYSGVLLAVWLGVGGVFGQAARAPEEMEQCRNNLQAIHSAIQLFRSEHKDLPANLEQLVPKYLADPKALVCPTARRLGKGSGDVSAGSKQRGSPGASYVYEFRTTPIPPEIAGGSTHTMREWKQLQMTLLGSDVPTVRCHNHTRDLNLAFGGWIYESTSDFEDNFANVVPIEELIHHKLFERYTTFKVIRIPERPPVTSPSLIDLSDYYNASLREGWTSQNKSNNLQTLGAGVLKLQGHEYDVRGIIQLGARTHELGHYPRAVSNVAVQVKCERLAFLHGAVQETDVDKTIGHYVVHYADGKTTSIPIIYGRHVLNWWSDPTKPGRFARPLDSVVAWQGSNAARQKEGKGKLIYLYQTLWSNPRPDTVITSLDFLSAWRGSGPFLIALSAEPSATRNHVPAQDKK